ncbi:MAG: spore coat protein [Bacillota bacterium]
MAEQTYRPMPTLPGAGGFAKTGMETNWGTAGGGMNWGTAGMPGGAGGVPAGPGANIGAGQRKFGAHETMEAHEVLTDIIDGINQFELYRPHVQDRQLMSILDNQIRHMSNDYDNMVNYLHNQGAGAAIPYRMKKNFQPQYGLRQPAPQHPNTDVNQMDDRDVASGMLGCNKASALVCTAAALECTDPTLRSMVLNCAVSSVNKAYEVFQYMNQKGMYQVPTMQQNTTNTMMNTYQQAGNMQFTNQ